MALSVLGDTRSGKSTIFKQFRLLSGDRFTSQDRRDAVNPIRVVLEDSISDMYECLIGIKNSGIKFGDERSRAFQIIVLENKYPLNYLHDSFIRVIAAVKALWRDQLVQNFMYTKIGLQHNNIAHYLNNAERIVERCFIPSDQDILGLWTQSTGVYSRPMMIKDVIYNVYDVGGARSERKKWVHSFEAVDCVIFTVGLSDYNEYWYGDMNTLEESLELFKSIITGKWFTKSAFFLVFTKVDFFKEKLIHDPLENHFPDYRGGRDPSHALEYWEQRFIDLKPHPDRQLHIQFAATAASFKDTIVVMHFFMQEQLSLARRQHGVIVATTGSTSHARHDSSKQNKAGPDSPQRFDNQSAQHRQPLKADADPEEKESDALLRFDFELFDGGISSTTSPEVLRSRPGAL
ncbi:guanine nucleotide-binding protein subunit alpha [Xylographa trunciseda]|nr:guanine nucleotide-binding protein subunit alpha [Xylographa trunciseda]